MKIQSIIFATSVWVLLSTSTPAGATAIYTYTGNNYDVFSDPTSYTTEMSVSGTVELSEQLANGATTVVTPISFSFFDGVRTLDSTTYSDASFEFTVTPGGDMLDWNMDIQLTGGDHVFFIKSYGIADATSALSYDTAGCYHYDLPSGTNTPCHDVGFNPTDNIASVQSKRGSWEVEAVPLPATFWLFGSGLLGLIGVARRKVCG